MKSGELRGETDQQLRERLTQLRRERFNLRFQQATGQLEATNRTREVRHDIARVLGVMGERTRAAAAEKAAAAKSAARSGGTAAGATAGQET